MTLQFTRQLLLIGTGIFCATVATLTVANAQSKPTKLIVPYGKGGGSDQLSRAMAKSVEAVSDTRFNIVNIKKGAGLGALPEFMRQDADGFTVIEHIDDIAAAYAIGATRIHPARDWQPLSIVQLTFSQLFIKKTTLDSMTGSRFLLMRAAKRRGLWSLTFPMMGRWKT